MLSLVCRVNLINYFKNLVNKSIFSFFFILGGDTSGIFRRSWIGLKKNLQAKREIIFAAMFHPAFFPFTFATAISIGLIIST